MKVDPKTLYGTQHFVVMMPKSMQFTAAPGTAFKSMKDPRQSDALVEVASDTTAGQPLAFKIAGTGLLGEANENAGSPGPAEGGQETAGGTVGRDSRPGGGLGPPYDAPDPLEKYRWYILGGFGVVLAGGAIFIVGRSKMAPVPDFVASDMQAPSVPPIAKPVAAGRSAMLLEALKEELFQLEVDHKKGSISQQEYEKAKAALDQTLERAVKRQAGKLRNSRGPLSGVSS